MECHKGEPCPYKKGVLCQEVCMRCQIYEDTRESKLLSGGLPARMGDSRIGRVNALASGGIG